MGAGEEDDLVLCMADVAAFGEAEGATMVLEEHPLSEVAEEAGDSPEVQGEAAEGVGMEASKILTIR